MKKYICSVCGYVHEGDSAPDICPQCKAPASKFTEQSSGMTWAAEHVVGIATKTINDMVRAGGMDSATAQYLVEGLRANFLGETSEVGMYLAMSRAAAREGYPEIAEIYERAAYDEANHAAIFAELLGEVVTDSTKKNLEMRVEAENGACAGKVNLAQLAKEQGYDAIHDTIHEMAKDDARHGKALKGLLDRYFS